MIMLGQSICQKWVNLTNKVEYHREVKHNLSVTSPLHSETYKLMKMITNTKYRLTTLISSHSTQKYDTTMVTGYIKCLSNIKMKISFQRSNFIEIALSLKVTSI